MSFFADIGTSIFGWFPDGDDTSRIVEVSSRSEDAGFTVSRANNDDGTVGTALAAIKQFPANSLISNVVVTASDTDNPSLEVTSDRLQGHNVTMSAFVCDPEMTLQCGYNDQKRYSLDLSLNTEFGSMLSPDLHMFAAADSLMNNKLLIGGMDHFGP